MTELCFLCRNLNKIGSAWVVSGLWKVEVANKGSTFSAGLGVFLASFGFNCTGNAVNIPIFHLFIEHHWTIHYNCGYS